MVSKKNQKEVGRTEEIALGTTLITSSEFLSPREPFRCPPGPDFDVMRGIPWTLFCPSASCSDLITVQILDGKAGAISCLQLHWSPCSYARWFEKRAIVFTKAAHVCLLKAFIISFGFEQAYRYTATATHNNELVLCMEHHHTLQRGTESTTTS